MVCGYKQQPGLFRLPVVAICEWLLVLPSAVLLAAAALRMLQPGENEPARMTGIFLEWTVTHVSRLEAAILFIGMPGTVFITGCAVLLRKWRRDPALRRDWGMIFSILWRHLTLGLLIAAVLLSGVFLTAVTVHLVTD